MIVGIVLTSLFDSNILPFSLSREHLVNIPVPSSLSGFFGQFTFPDFSQLRNPNVYLVALTLAIIASLETLLCVEATDKLDPNKGITPTNRELKAQGIGNIVSGLIGGLPVTQVIVRSSANITFGGKTKLSTILHGCFLLICALTIPSVLNMIPLATLACILFVVGYKLAKPSLFMAMYRMGWDQFIPFIVTVAAIIFTDLLKGIGFGMVVAVFYILRNHYRNAYSLERLSAKGDKPSYKMLLAEEVSFLNKGNILRTLNELPQGSNVVVDGSYTKIIDHDVIDVIRNFMITGARRNITVTATNIPGLTEEKSVQEPGVITDGQKASHQLKETL